MGFAPSPLSGLISLILLICVGCNRLELVIPFLSSQCVCLPTCTKLTSPINLNKIVLQLINISTSFKIFFLKFLK